MKGAVAPEPQLSVVVAVVDGGTALRRCLEALTAQIDAPALEVIVPWDDGTPGVGALAPCFPHFRFLALEPPADPGTSADAFVRHGHYDRRRAAGLRAARGALVAMLEDRGWPRPDWARAMAEVHARVPHAAVGGAIENGAADVLRRAIFYCDFGRYEPPLVERDACYLSDINVCYKREALDRVRVLWSARYQEAEVHWALAARGERLLLCAAPRVVQQREALSLPDALRERFHWGRVYGIVRGRHASRLRALLLAAAAPLVPAVLCARHLRRQARRGRLARARFGELAPFALLSVFWAAGEAIGEIEAALTRGGERNQRSARLQ